MGQHHHISGKYLLAYAREMAWKEDNRRVANGTQHEIVTSAALAHPVSRVWAGYWQRGNLGLKRKGRRLRRPMAVITGPR